MPGIVFRNKFILQWKQGIPFAARTAWIFGLVEEHEDEERDQDQSEKYWQHDHVHVFRPLGCFGQ